MRRVMLLALLALALPTAALAHHIEFSSGTFEQGTITSSFGEHFRVQVVGTDDTITLNIENLDCVDKETVCYFTAGTVRVVNPAGVTVFRDGLEYGNLRVGNGTIRTVSIFAYILPNSIGTGGSTTFNVKFKGDTLLVGDAGVLTAPEPGTFEGLLLGTGAIGLAEMTRRKLRLGT